MSSSDLDNELLDGPKQLPDDVSLQAVDEDQDDDDQSSDSSDETRGPLLDLPPVAAAKYCLKLWRAQDRTMNRRKVRWRAAHLRRMGVPGVRLIRQDYDHAPDWTLWVSPATPSSPPVSNMAARMCRRLADYIFSDPPEPDPIPSKDTDTDRAAAEFAGRVLEDIGSESGTKNLRTARGAFDKMCTYASGFRYHYVDPLGGGHRAKEIMCSSKATHVEDALDPDGMPLDPTTGLEDPNPVKRYVAPDGQIVDDESAADREWMPALKTEVLTGHHIRFLPETADGIWDAEGCLIATFTTLGKLRAAFPDEIEKMGAPEVRQMVKFRPERYRDILPHWMHEVPTGTLPEPTQGSEDRQDEAVPDDAGVFVLRGYYTQSSSYPHGCDYVMAGGDKTLYRDVWEAEDAQGGMMKLDVPVDQLKGYAEGEDDPYGVSVMEKMGGMNETREAQMAFLLEHLDRFMHRKVFLPVGSIVQPRAMQQLTGTYIAVNQGGTPTFEQVPEFPGDSMNLYDRMTTEITDEAGLSGSSNLADKHITSGSHATLTVEQANKALTELYENTKQCLVRGWRIQLQLMRAFFDTPQIMLWLGPDNAWKAEEWDRSDLGNTKDVRIQAGTFTMMTPSMKAQIAEQYAQTGWLDPREGREIVRSNMAPILAIQDDPALLRVRRQISAWKNGPDEKLKAASEMFQAQQQQQQAMAPPAPAPPQPGQPPTPPPVPGSPPAGAQAPPPMDPMQQAASQIFARQPTDKEPLVAQIRHSELARVVQAADFAKFPVPWQQALLTEYDEMRVRGGVYTIEENRQIAQYQVEMNIWQIEAPRTRLEGPPPPSDAPPPTQPGQANAPDPTQPNPNGQPGAPQQAPMRPPPQMPVSANGHPLMPGGGPPTAGHAPMGQPPHVPQTVGPVKAPDVSHE